MLREYWEIVITRTARQISGARGVDYRTFHAAVEAFDDLKYDESPTTRRDIDAIVCTGGRLFRQKSSRPIYLLHYRSVFAIVRQQRDDGKRGMLVLCAVLPRDADTYNPDVLRAMIARIVAEAKAEEKVLA